MGFLHLKGIVEALLGELGIKKFSFVVSGRPDRVDINTDACSLGFIERLSSHTKERFDIKYKDVFVAELSLEKIMPRVNLERRFEVLSKYPSISRDISFVIPGQIPLGEILDVMKEKGEPLLYEIKLVDFYKGKQIPADCRGLTLSCIYHSEERTLTESEIIPLHESISSILIERFQAKIR
jgi:phenylalanyl-tRNA synthetase beta chain